MIWLFLAQTASRAPDEMEDIRPPIADSPSLMIVAILACLLMLALVAYFVWPNPKSRAVLPPLPKEVARRRLEALKQGIGSETGYDFSIKISDVLRSFIEQHFGIKAVRQTTIEFLMEASKNSHFDLAQQERLRQFLLTCDSIKFARANAGVRENETLFEQAAAFVEEAK
jgi:hypothetical protein